MNTDKNKSTICILVKGTYAITEWNVYKYLKTLIQTSISQILAFWSKEVKSLCSEMLKYLKHEYRHK